MTVPAALVAIDFPPSGAARDSLRHPSARKGLLSIAIAAAEVSHSGSDDPRGVRCALVASSQGLAHSV
jgi:hypothetical protein